MSSVWRSAANRLPKNSVRIGPRTEVTTISLNELEWRILEAIKREFEPDELKPDLWAARAQEAGVPRQTFFEVAEDFNRRKIIGRFSTFLEHVKPHTDGERVTRFNALLHWAVPPGRELAAGQEVGRHHIMTHAYWRDREKEREAETHAARVPHPICSSRGLAGMGDLAQAR